MRSASQPSGQLEQQSPLLPTDPPARVARWTAQLLLAVFAAALAFASLVKFPETILVPLEIVAQEGTRVLTAPCTGELTTVRVVEGQEVKAGAELFVLQDGDASLSIRAPQDGVIVVLGANRAGAAVAAGGELCQILPTQAKLEARLRIPEAARLLTRVGQLAHLRLEAYPYQRLGCLQAQVNWISPEMVLDSEPRGFVARAVWKPEAATGQLVPKHGMRGQAQLVVGRRTLLQKFLLTSR